jgi:uncharacterized LabA/DUF88 family protein
MQRAMIFIDGSNFYHSLKKSFGTASIDVEKFCRKIERERSIEGIFYYTAPVNQREYPERFKAQQLFLLKLMTIPNLILFLGRLENRSNGKLIEKAVDVKLAVDLIMNAIDDNYDAALLVSNDADFSPAIEEVQKLGKKVIHVAFPKMQSFHLDNVCDATITINSIDDVILPANDEHKSNA